MNNAPNISAEEIRGLLAFKKQWEQEQQQRLVQSCDLPDEIREDLELPKTAIKKFCGTFLRGVPTYEGSRFTQAPCLNKAIVPELQKATVSTYSAVQSKFKDAEKLRAMAASSALIFEEMVAAMADDMEANDPRSAQFQAIGERARRAAVFGYAAAIQIEEDVRGWTDRACGVPEHLQVHDEEEGRSLLYDPEFLRTLHQTKFEQAVLSRAMARNQGGNMGFTPRGRGNGRARGRGRGGSPRQFQSRPQEKSSQSGAETNPRPALSGGQ
ncbi:hypothetical protein CLU79DRAFT_855568 [Phycomyces nitens]|nr:hypothetical protein CLU79DRAFT_855568 [Phycomyces nitens]